MNIEPRPLEIADYDKGFLSLLEQLTTVGPITKEQFLQQFSYMGHNVYVIEHPEQKKIIACATLFFEYKFIHNCSCVAHIEDVVIDSEYRGQGLGKFLMNFLVKQAGQKPHCYKIILNSHSSKTTFYTKCGFHQNEVQMTKYFYH